mgnify:CR=1 FL=1
MPTLRSYTHLLDTQVSAQPNLTNRYSLLTHNDRLKSTGYNARRRTWRAKWE